MHNIKIFSIYFANNRPETFPGFLRKQNQKLAPDKINSLNT